MSDPFAGWIRSVHAALEPSAQERQSAAWGPVTMRHRTTRPEWFGAMDVAWAVPIDRGHDVDVITASVADLPADIHPPPLRRSELGPRREVPIPAGSKTRLVWAEQAGYIVGWDPEVGIAVLLTSEPPNGYDLVSPMRVLVHWLTIAAGGVLVHGATVGRRRGDRSVGLLLLGEAGFGKSTSTLACLGRGWSTCGDDAVAVYGGGEGWHACAIYAAIKTKLGGAAPADLPTAGPATVTWEVGGTKRVHLLTATDQRALEARMELTGLVLLNPTADPEEPVRPASVTEVRTHAAPSTVLSLPFERAEMLKSMGHLAAELPGYWLPRRTSAGTTVADLARIADDSEPFVSVVIPLFNGKAFVAEAIRSILAQSIGRFQIIAVSDASPDESLAVVESLRAEVESLGHELVTMELPQNRGIAAARNAGLAAAHGHYIAWLDQDDLWPPARTSVLWAALRRANAPIAQGMMTFTDITPEVQRSWLREAWFDGPHRGYVLGALLVTAQGLEAVGLLGEEFSTGSDDVDWFMRARHSQASIALVDEVVVWRQIHTTNQSARASQKELLTIVRAHVARNQNRTP